MAAQYIQEQDIEKKICYNLTPLVLFFIFVEHCEDCR